jgi:monoamine oxidase
VGGGLAGLLAARSLRRAGANVKLYEGASILGGRVQSLRGVFPGQIAELGGELIDNPHKTMLGLAREFDLQIEDVNKTDGEVFYYFFGQHYTEADVVEEFRQFIPALKTDLRRISGEVTASNFTPNDRQQDLISVQDYLEGQNSLGMQAGDLLREVIRVAYTIEYGLETFEQSSLNFLHFVHADNRSTFKPFGIFSDERYHLTGGNDQIIQRLAIELESTIEVGRKLVRVARLSDGRIALSFDSNGSTTRVHDRVILAIPFTTLRQVDLQASLALPTWKKNVLSNFSIGANTKQMVGFVGRPWADLGSNGASYSDLSQLQCTWETNRSRSTSSNGLLTNFLGGVQALMVNPSDPQQEAARFLSSLNEVYPGAGMRALRSGGQVVTAIAHWSSNPWVRGGYTCYRPGDFTSIAGLEGKPCGNLHFAGEHTDSFYSWQGFMEGACLSGLRAASEVLA